MADTPQQKKPSRSELQSWLILELEEQAKEVWVQHRQARTKCEHCSHTKRRLIAAANRLGVVEDRRHDYLNMIRKESNKGNDRSGLIERSIEYINDEYENGTHDGREMLAFFRKLFGMIDEKMLLQFDKDFRSCPV